MNKFVVSTFMCISDCKLVYKKKISKDLEKKFRDCLKKCNHKFFNIYYKKSS